MWTLGIGTLGIGHNHPICRRLIRIALGEVGTVALWQKGPNQRRDYV